MPTPDLSKQPYQGKLRYKRFIIAVSIIVPIAVGLLFRVQIEGYDFSFLPPFYASMNALTALCLIVALIAIKRKNVKLHRALTTASIVFSAIFLVSYVLYHSTSDPTPYGGEGFISYIYYFILITHILLSVVVIPLVLITFVRALSRQFIQHRRMARITFPVWLYVAISGVVVYLMISPYYG